MENLILDRTQCKPEKQVSQCYVGGLSMGVMEGGYVEVAVATRFAGKGHDQAEKRNTPMSHLPERVS